ncbi:MAG: transglycosylase SLT domain-containing protein, partial [Candidatus Margulisbacteria bacterium]|nr:transglycosylase SLT domain-containing protein [Candidatus Margulisiibacteriota bacterium]
AEPEGAASYHLALAKGGKGNYDAAISILQGILRKYPSSEIIDRTYYYLGHYQELNDQPAKALQSYWKLLEKCPQSNWAADAVWRIGRIYYWSGNYEQAYNYLSLVSQYPRNKTTARALYFQAKAAEKINKPDDALALYQYIAGNFDSCYYGYRAQEQLQDFGIILASPTTDAVSQDPLWRKEYPREYFVLVSYKSDVNDIDPYLTLAVIREESRFKPSARSRSNARGLMQIIPSTGRAIAKDLKMKKFRTAKLHDPTTNIDMGTYYLSNLIGRFDGNVYLALAGYNGGPNRIKKYIKTWYNGDQEQLDIDEFIESIPVRETRLYVQKVMESYFNYKRIYGRG